MAKETIGILYEHPEWFKPLFTELERRGVNYQPLAIRDHLHDPSDTNLPYKTIVNRVSAYPSGGSHHGVINYTKELLLHYERNGVPVINGYFPFVVGASKALQMSILRDLKLNFPKTRVVHHPEQLLRAADNLAFPLLLKPSVGGSGVGIKKFEDVAQLETAVASGRLDFGIDGVAVLQECLKADGQSIYRVEVLNGKFLCGLRLSLRTDSFNYCPADGCLIAEEEKKESELSYCPADSRDKAIERFDPSREVIEQVLAILHRTRAQIGGVEYLINEADGKPYYFDINPLSNFVANAETILGFDPLPRFVDFILEYGRQQR